MPQDQYIEPSDGMKKMMHDLTVKAAEPAIIDALGDVYDWFQSDEAHPKPILDVLREVAQTLRFERHESLVEIDCIKDLLLLCLRKSMDADERSEHAVRVAAKARVIPEMLRGEP